ncbi:glycosyltransferase family 2 protein [Modicisalibacter luteus]|uniref:glycosyltransferase family 2 protein n=1 Tax=Modicisalibacter luteus TaxID=453962 RepID=UPI003621E1C3
MRSVQKTLDSVLSQTFENFELVIVDDGSGDVFNELLKHEVQVRNDERIKVHCLTKNVGGGGARNHGIAAAQGEYIAFLDSDDIWKENKLEKDYNIILANKGVDVVYSPIVNFVNGVKGKITPSRSIGESESIGDYLFANVKNGRGMQTSTLVVKTSLAKNNLFNEKLRGHQDWDFLLRLGGKKPRVKFSPYCLTERHVYVNQSLSDNVSRNLDYLFSKQFYTEYKKFLSAEARIYYRTRVLLPKSIKSRKELFRNLFYFGNALDIKFIISKIINLV